MRVCIIRDVREKEKTNTTVVPLGRGVTFSRAVGSCTCMNLAKVETVGLWSLTAG